MDANRPYKCHDCSKAFKLKNNLKSYKPICSGKDQCFQCKECDKKFTSKKTLKFHVNTTCKPFKIYQCPHCTKSFFDYINYKNHYSKKHSKINCDFCDLVCDETYFKRHMHAKHKKLRPSTTPLIPLTSKLESNFKCDECQKCFYDKSTLNRHKKIHSVKCKYCEKHFQSKTKVLEHQVSHLKKNVCFKENIAEVKEIPCSKVPLNNETVNTIHNLKRTIDALMLIFTNRGQSVTLETLKLAIERITKKDLSENMFRAVLSVNPDDYSLTMLKKNYTCENGKHE